MRSRDGYRIESLDFFIHTATSKYRKFRCVKLSNVSYIVSKLRSACTAVCVAAYRWISDIERPYIVTKVSITWGAQFKSQSEEASVTTLISVPLVSELVTTHLVGYKLGALQSYRYKA